MQVDIDHALEDCLQRLRRGDDLESCLSAYPEYATRLRPLLETVSVIGRTLAPPTATSAREAGRQRMLAAVARREERRARWGPLARLFQLPISARPAWRLAAMLLALCLLAGGGAAAASAGSLPGDALYPLKEAGRQLRLVLNFDPGARQLLVDRLEARQREEVGRAMLAGHRASVEFQGVLEGIEPQQWTVGGLSVAFGPGVAIEGRPAIGSNVRVRGELEGGLLLARELVVEGEGGEQLPPDVTSPATPPARTPTAFPSATPSAPPPPTGTTPTDPAGLTAEPSETRELEAPPSPSPLATTTEAGEPGESEEPEQTPESELTLELAETPEPEETYKPGPTPEQEETPEPDETQEPDETPEQDETQEQDKTPEPDETPEPGED